MRLKLVQLVFFCGANYKKELIFAPWPIQFYRRVAKNELDEVQLSGTECRIPGMCFKCLFF